MRVFTAYKKGRKEAGSLLLSSSLLTAACVPSAIPKIRVSSELDSTGTRGFFSGERMANTSRIGVRNHSFLTILSRLPVRLQVVSYFPRGPFRRSGQSALLVAFFRQAFPLGPTPAHGLRLALTPRRHPLPIFPGETSV